MANIGTRRGTLDFPLQVATGSVDGVASFRRFGMNNVVVAGTFDIWPSATTRTLPTVAGVASVVSTSANDAAAGTGTRTIYIEGLDTNYAEITETVTLNGLTPVTTVQSFLRINSAYGVTGGSGATNAGRITISIGGSLQNIIEAAEGQSHCTQYTVPANKSVLALGIRFGTGRMAPGDDLHILAQIKLFGADTTWRSLQDVYLFQNIYQPPHIGGEVIPAKTECRFQVTSTGVTQVWAEWAGYTLS